FGFDRIVRGRQRRRVERAVVVVLLGVRVGVVAVFVLDRVVGGGEGRRVVAVFDRVVGVVRVFVLDRVVRRRQRRGVVRIFVFDRMLGVFLVFVLLLIVRRGQRGGVDRAVVVVLLSVGVVAVFVLNRIVGRAEGRRVVAVFDG